MTIIETMELSKRYRGTTAVDGISFSVERGQVFGFLGPNGCGKTTTIGMLLGIINPTSGGIRLFDRYGLDELHTARQRIGATLETPNFYPYLSGYENLRIVAAIKNVERPRIDQALAMVGLTDRRKDRFGKYSLGMKQRLGIAGAMLGDPDLIILDEPANGLDPEGIREIRDIIRNMAADGRTIFLSSHLLNEVERTCSHVAIVKKGRIIHQSSMADIQAGRTSALVRAADTALLLETARAYPHAVRVVADNDAVIVDLDGDDLAALNAHLAAHGVHASYLAPRTASLEDTFMDLTVSA